MLDELIKKIETYILDLKRKPDLATHYCSLESGLSILDSQSLWMTHHAHMNDPSEINYGLKLMLKLFKSYSAKDLIEPINHLYKNYNSLLTCFMSKQDDLLGWRLYGDNGKGIAINFNTELIPSKSSSLCSLPVLYSEEEQQGLINIICDYYDLIIKDKDSDINPVAIISTILPFVLPLLKNPDYEPENEWRVFSAHLFCENIQENAFKPIPTEHLIEGRGKPTYNYFPFRLDAIESIHVGPCGDYFYISEMIKKIFLRKKINSNLIKIIRSEKSYRT